MKASIYMSLHDTNSSLQTPTLCSLRISEHHILCQDYTLKPRPDGDAKRHDRRSSWVWVDQKPGWDTMCRNQISSKNEKEIPAQPEAPSMSRPEYVIASNPTRSPKSWSVQRTKTHPTDHHHHKSQHPSSAHMQGIMLSNSSKTSPWFEPWCQTEVSISS